MPGSRDSYDPHGLDAALPYMSRANPRLLASGTYYVAEIDGVAAGCGGWSVEKPGSGEIIAGDRPYPAFRHASRLMCERASPGGLLQHCLAEAGEAGIRR